MTTNHAPILTFATTDSDGIDYYQVKIDAGSFTRQVSPYQLPSLSNGTHTLLVRAFDVIGNYTDGSVIVTMEGDEPEPSPSPSPDASPVPSSAPAPEANSTNEGGSNVSSEGEHQPQFCSASRPVTAPHLFAIQMTHEGATLSWEPVGGQVTTYVVSYGLTDSADRYATQFEAQDETGVIQHQIGILQPDTTYYFKVMAKNECAPSEWSSVLSGQWSENQVSTDELSPSKLELGLAVSPSPSVAMIASNSPSPVADTVTSPNNKSLPAVMKKALQFDPFVYIGIGSVRLAGVFWWLYKNI